MREANLGQEARENDSNHLEERQKSSYRDTVMGINQDTQMEEKDLESKGEILVDDTLKKDDAGPWFSMGMSKEEKYEARKPWRTSLVIKQVTRTIGYQFLLRRLHSLWRIQHSFTLIDLNNDYFIARFSNKQDYEVALSMALGSLSTTTFTCNDGCQTSSQK